MTAEDPLRAVEESDIETEKLLKGILSATREGVLVADTDGNIITYNKQFVEMWSIPDDLLEQRDDDLLLKHVVDQLKNPDHFIEKVRELYEDTERDSRNLIEFKDGRVFRRLSRPVNFGDGRTVRVWSFQDITRQVNARKKAQKRAKEDYLTGLPTRLYFHEQLRETLERARERDHRVAVYCLDIHQLKRLNNALGHETGDSVLRECARRWRAIRDDWTIGRTGGDEFMAFVVDFDDKDQLESIANDLIEAVETPFEINGSELTIRINVGISLFPQDNEDVDGLISMADRAMQKARERGINEYRFFLPRMSRDLSSDFSLELDLKQAIEGDNLELYYQPQVSIPEQETIGFEALLRWNHPEKGWITPHTVIPLAEETGLINEIGDWVLRESCRQARDWRERYQHDFRVSVNVSAEQLVQPDRFYQSVEEAIQTANLPADALELELTENLALQDVETISNLLSDLGSMGIRNVIDDFGTGYSTIQYLEELPYDGLKIDRSFVSTMIENNDKRTLVEIMIDLAEKLNLDIVAEGVETAEQVDLLCETDCNVAQGFHFSRPQPTDSIEAYFENDEDWPLG